MALFELEDINASKPEKDDSQPNGHRFKTSNRFTTGRKAVSLADTIGSLAHQESMHVVSLGNWSSHELLAYLLSLSGPADVYLTSWSIKRQAVQMMLELLDSEKIRSLKCIFDNRVKAQCPDAWALAEYNIDMVKLTKIHAKVTVIQNENWHFSVISSANLTRNPRIEAYSIVEDKSTAEYHKSWILGELANAKPFAS